jgi:hypothetical protein
MCTRKATSKTPRPLAQVHQRRTREQLPWLHQPAVDYSNDATATSPSPAAVAPLQPFRLPTILTLHQLCRVLRLLAVRIAPSLLRLCRASIRGVSPLNFSSVGRSHWLSQCVRSLRLAVRLLTVRIAPALLHLCRASGRAVSPLDFSSVGRTGSHRVSGHCVSWRDYLPSGLHRLYRAYVVHPDAPSRRSTSEGPIRRTREGGE